LTELIDGDSEDVCSANLRALVEAKWDKWRWRWRCYVATKWHQELIIRDSWMVSMQTIKQMIIQNTSKTKTKNSKNVILELCNLLNFMFLINFGYLQFISTLSA
jgi:hypothetical protein